MYKLVLLHEEKEQTHFRLPASEVEYLIVCTDSNILTLVQPEQIKKQKIWARLAFDGKKELTLFPKEELFLENEIPMKLSKDEKYTLKDGDILVLGEEYKIEVHQMTEVKKSSSLEKKPNLFFSLGNSTTSGVFDTTSFRVNHIGDLGKSRDLEFSYRSVKGSNQNVASYSKNIPTALPILEASAAKLSLDSNKETLSETKKAEDKLSYETNIQYFNQMHPFHTYPVRVFLSEGKIAELKLDDITEATENPLLLAVENPYVTITPIFPGALVRPEKIEVDVTRKLVETEFWVTPQTEGEIESAWVEFRFGGKELDRISVPFRVAKYTLIKAMLFCSLCFPFFSAVVTAYQVPLESQLGQGFSFFRPVFHLILATHALMGFVGFALLAAILYLWKKPKEAEPLSQVLKLDALLEADSSFFDFGKPGSHFKKVGKAQADEWYDQARKHFDDGKAELALEFYEKALLIYRNHRVCDEYGLMLCDMGRTLLAIDEYERALGVYAEEQSVWVRLGQEVDRGRCLSNIGITHRLRKEYKKAEIFLREAVDIRKLASDTQGQRRSLKELGAVYELQTKWEDAQDIYLNLAELYQNEGNQEEYAHMLNLLGIVAYKSAEDELAIKNYKKSLHINDSLGLELPKADNLYNLGLVYKQRKNKEKALQYFREAHEIYVEQGDMDWARSAENSIRELEK